MKRFFSLTAVLKLFLLTSIAAGNPLGNGTDGKDGKDGKEDVTVRRITTESFKQLVYNYDKNKTWKFEGDKPVIIDFYATWCPPCRQLSPLVDEIAKEYSGKIVVYKVDTDQEKILSQRLGITGLPTLLFIPMKGEPQASMGYIPKTTIINTINKVLLNK
jgi:thioredoxin 1